MAVSHANVLGGEVSENARDVRSDDPMANLSPQSQRDGWDLGDF